MPLLFATPTFLAKEVGQIRADPPSFLKNFRPNHFPENCHDASRDEEIRGSVYGRGNAASQACVTPAVRECGWNPIPSHARQYLLEAVTTSGPGTDGPCPAQIIARESAPPERTQRASPGTPIPGSL